MENKATNNIFDLNDRRKERNEIGAVWSRTSRKGSPFMTIKVKLGPEELENLFEQIETIGDDKAELFLVAFPCDGGEVNDRKPTFRVFKDMRD